MLLPALASGEAPTTGRFSSEIGIAPSFCSPCIPIINQRVCGLPFSPHLEPCPTDPTTPPTCTNVGPCIPFINKQLRCCIPGGCSIVDC